jgi:hypothetical protein
VPPGRHRHGHERHHDGNHDKQRRHRISALARQEPPLCCQ